MTRIFISYRRSDSAYVASVLKDKLEERFGRNSVFLDVDTIPFGVDFREYITDGVTQSDVMLVIIGENWLKAKTEGGIRRLDNPDDFVRFEIETALKRKIPVIPVLIDKAEMPKENELPSTLNSLVFRNALEIRPGRDFRNHIDNLLQGLESLFSPPVPENTISRFFWKGAWGPGEIEVYLDDGLIGKGSFKKGIDLKIKTEPGSHNLKFIHGIPKKVSGPYLIKVPPCIVCEISLEYTNRKKEFSIERITELSAT
jgi:hypothetical protein